MTQITPSAAAFISSFERIESLRPSSSWAKLPNALAITQRIGTTSTTVM